MSKRLRIKLNLLVRRAWSNLTDLFTSTILQHLPHFLQFANTVHWSSFLSEVYIVVFVVVVVVSVVIVTIVIVSVTEQLLLESNDKFIL